MKFTSNESSLYAESNKLKFINFKQTFTNTNFEIKKSYKFCYVVNWCNLDWTSCAIPLKPGREFSTYLVQSKLHFEEFYEFYQEFSINPQLSLSLCMILQKFVHHISHLDKGTCLFNPKNNVLLFQMLENAKMQHFSNIN